MNLFLVIYNVVGDDKRRDALRAEIKSHPHVELSESAYLILYPQTRAILWLDIVSHVSPSDDLIVANFDSDYSGQHRPEVRDWIRKHAPPPTSPR